MLLLWLAGEMFLRFLLILRELRNDSGARLETGREAPGSGGDANLQNYSEAEKSYWPPMNAVEHGCKDAKAFVFDLRSSAFIGGQPRLCVPRSAPVCPGSLEFMTLWTLS
jgi:hypothetical protein